MAENMKVIDFLNETSELLEVQEVHSVAKTSPTTVVTVTGHEIPMNRAYQIIKRGEFVGWGRM